MTKRRELINKITKISIFAALSFILYLLKFNLPFMFPEFLEVNFSMLPIILGAFMFGPTGVVVIVIIRFLLKLPLTSTAYVGEISDFCIGLITALPISFIYKSHRTKKMGTICLMIAILTWTIGSIVSNLITLPLYLNLFFKDNVNILISSLSVIPNVTAENYMIKYIIFAVIPFNLLLSFFVSLVTFFVYKNVSQIFKHDFFEVKSKPKVMIMVDSFKGTLTTSQVGSIINEELTKKGYKSDYLPISDGGEGFLEVIRKIKKIEYKEAKVCNAFEEYHIAHYIYDEAFKTAYIELSDCCGINNVPIYQLDPFEANSYGLGEMIKYVIINHNPETIYVGIGGSASNDAGAGMLEALGMEFYDDKDESITHLNNEKLTSIKYVNIKPLEQLLKNTKIIVLSDVENPLTGINGATYVYALQKGALQTDLPVLEENIIHFTNILFPKGYQSMIGDGAAGGVGFAFNQIIKAKHQQGIAYILSLFNFEDIVNKYDIIITGEGCFDEQSLNGKVINGIMEYHPKKIVVITGMNKIENSDLEIHAIVPTICSYEKALINPEISLRKLVRRIKLKKPSTK